MMTHRTVFATLAAVVLCAVSGTPRNGPAPAADPRVGLTPGFRTAGESARNMQLVSTLPKPEGFFDPKAPAGQVTPPETPPAQNSETPGASPAAAPAREPDAEDEPTAQGAPPNPNTQITFANSDLAFSGDLLFVGNFQGFNTYDIENGAKPRLLASVVCPGGQGDVSVYGRLLIVSVEQTTRTRRLRDRRRHRQGQRRTVSWHPHLRHQQSAKAQAGGRHSDVPRLTHPHARARSEGSTQPVRVRVGHWGRASP